MQELLEWLSSGATQEEILADFPQLEAEDFLAVYAYAAELAAADRRTNARMKLLFDESLSPKLIGLIGDLFPEFESARRNGSSSAQSLRSMLTTSVCHVHGRIGNYF